MQRDACGQLYSTPPFWVSLCLKLRSLIQWRLAACPRGASSRAPEGSRERTYAAPKSEGYQCQACAVSEGEHVLAGESIRQVSSGPRRPLPSSAAFHSSHNTRIHSSHVLGSLRLKTRWARNLTESNGKRWYCHLPHCLAAVPEGDDTMASATCPWGDLSSRDCPLPVGHRRASIQVLFPHGPSWEQQA